VTLKHKHITDGNHTSTNKHCKAIRHDKEKSISGETWIAAQLDATDGKSHNY
jgi:hypothetical protein